MSNTDIFWVAALDGDLSGADRRRSRAAAELDAAWLRAHPARRDRVISRLGGEVRVTRIMKSEWTDEWIEVRS